MINENYEKSYRNYLNGKSALYKFYSRSFYKNNSNK